MTGWIPILVGIFIILSISACREEGAAEKAGRQIDEAVEKIQHGDEGTLEKAGRKMDEALDEAEEKLKDEE